jgi:hypothetical protein
MTDQNRPDTPDPLPESAMGGATDMGAHGTHPLSSPALKQEHRSPLPEDAPGDAPIERRHHHDSDYSGPERRIAAR